LSAIIEIFAHPGTEQPIAKEVSTKPAITMKKVVPVVVLEESPIKNSAAGFGMIINRQVLNIKKQMKKQQRQQPAFKVAAIKMRPITAAPAITKTKEAANYPLYCN